MHSHSFFAIHNMTITQGAGDRMRTLLSHASFSMEEKEIVGLQGANGVGKTTLVLSLLGLLRESSSFVVKGKAFFKGIDLLSLTPLKRQEILGRDIGFIFQDPTTALDPLKTVEEHLLESVLNHQKLSKKQACARAIELLTHVHLSWERYFNAYPFQLSGGEAQRVMIAMAIANNPSLLIADEPATALDSSVQGEIIDLLKSLQQKLGMSILLISHDLDLLKEVSHRIVTLENGDFHPYQAIEDTKQKRQKLYSLKSPLVSLLEAHDIHVNFGCAHWFQRLFFMRSQGADHHAINGISLTLYKGEILGIVGENGAGKTTLAKALLQLLPMTGKIIFDGCDVTQLSSKDLRQQRKEMQMIFQNPISSLNPKFTVLESIEDGLKLHEPEMSYTERLERVKHILELVGLESALLSSYPEMLSGGEAQRVALARSLVLNPTLLILDEPTASLDSAALRSFLKIVQTMNKRNGTSFLIISHNRDMLNALCHRIVAMKRGRLL
jgi:ABC-type microcin C transport system duplicated ATPase subunit YejF